MDTARMIEIFCDCHGYTDESLNALPGTELVDVWLVVALKPDKVREHAAEMIELLKEWPDVCYDLPVPPLGEKISYLIAGLVLGDTRWAFKLFAFGKLLGWWEIEDPVSTHGLSKSDMYAKVLFNRGWVSIVGYDPK